MSRCYYATHDSMQLKRLIAAVRIACVHTSLCWISSWLLYFPFLAYAAKPFFPNIFVWMKVFMIFKSKVFSKQCSRYNRFSRCYKRRMHCAQARRTACFYSLKISEITFYYSFELCHLLFVVLILLHLVFFLCTLQARGSKKAICIHPSVHKQQLCAKT